MLPKSKKQSQGLPGQFMFVGGPKLKHESGEVWSKLLRRVSKESRTKKRKDAADKLELMLKKPVQEDGTALCSCSTLLERQGAWASCLDSRESARYRMVMPKGWNKQDGGRCPNCGGIIRLVASATKREWAQARVSSLQLLGAGRSDPLLAVNPRTAKLKMHELLNFAATLIWPHFRGLGHATNCYQNWIFPLEDNLQLYAILWAASYHRNILRVTHGAPCPESKEQLELKSLALRALQKEVSNVSKLTSPDGLVMCILWTAANDKHKKIVRDPSPFSPPFTNLQALDFCGGQEYHPLHWNVVQDIIRRFSGIGSSLCRPIYPAMRIHGQRLDLQPPTLLFQPHGYYDEGPVPAGSGFHELFYMWPPVKPNLVQVFIHLGQYSAVLQYFQGGACSPMVLNLLGDSRNLVHHRLLSLPDEHGPVDLILQYKDQAMDELKLSWEIYLTCRLSVILYAVHVKFPAPRSQALREILLHSLRPRLDNLRILNVSSPLLIWCLTVIISTMGDKSPDALVTYVARLCRDFGVYATQKLSGLLRTFVWVDAAVYDC